VRAGMQGIDVLQPKGMGVINSAVRRVINRIENQHIIVFSALLSVSIGTSLSLFINEVASTILPLNPPRVSPVSALLIALWYFIVLPLILFIIGILILTFVYVLFRGVYSSTFTFIYRVIAPANAGWKSWKKELKEILAPLHASELYEKYKGWHIYVQKCEDVYERGNEYVICEYTLKDPIKLKIRSMAFKLDNNIIWTSTLTACPMRALFLEARGGLLLEALAKLIVKLKRRAAIEVDLWYDVVESLTLFYDCVREKLEEKGIVLEDVVS
jgi:hypothetical protein